MPRASPRGANFLELRYGEVRAGVKVCIAPPRQDPDCASEVCPYSAPSIVCVRAYIKPTAAGIRAREGLGHRDGVLRGLIQDPANGLRRIPKRRSSQND